MGKLAKINADQLAAITEHNRLLSDAAETALTRLREISTAERTLSIRGQIRWWLHVRKCIKWSDGLARQRATRLGNVN